MEASECFDDGDLGEGVDYADLEVQQAAQQSQQAAQQWAEAIADQAAKEFVQRTDPLIAHQQAEEAEAWAAKVASMTQLAEDHPELAELPVAQAVVNDARRAAVELGIPERAEDPTFWRDVHVARQAGARGADVAYAIAERHAKEQIVTGGNPGSRGAGCLPFGGR
jgi:hypothetical protein